jgi:arylsulfatase A-like enzyme
VYVENHRVAGLRSATLNPGSATNFRGRKLIGLDAPQRVDPEVMPTLTRKAVAWLEQQEKGKPFFLYYAPVAVHNPITPSAKTRGSSKAGAFGDFIQELDDSIGRILEVLDRNGLASDTLVIFTSDNGGVNKPHIESPQTDAIRAGLKPCGPWRGGKHDVWEGGFRVPFVARWPCKGGIPAGTTRDEMVSLTDLFATVLAIVGEPMPPVSTAAEDSYNILPALLGRTHASPLRPDMIVHSADGNFAIRRGPWKYIEGKPAEGVKRGALKARADQMKPQLYNLRDDPGEQRNVLEQHPEEVEQLTDLLEKYRRQGSSRP